MSPLWTEPRVFLIGLGDFLPLRISRSEFELSHSPYLFPVALVALGVTFVLRRLQRRKYDRACGALKQSEDRIRRLEAERDLAQQEVFRRLV